VDNVSRKFLRHFCAAALLAGLSTTSRAQPVNNACANAIPIALTSGTTTVVGTNTGSTPDGTSSCWAGTGPDVWYSITPTSATYLNVSTCAGTAFDTVLSIHSGCPGNVSNQLACDDDSCGSQSNVSAQLATGSTYYIRFAGFSTANGPFALTVSLGPPPPPPAPPTSGPDLIVGEVTDVVCFGRVGDIVAYSVGADVCNAGDAAVPWHGETNQHPIIASSFYRLASGRFEQVGRSWAKHAFSPGNGSFCFTCHYVSGGNLGPGCDDVYTGSISGGQGAIGPRADINATTGAFPYPFSAAAPAPIIGRRLQAAFDDMDPAQNPGASYFAETMYLTPDEAAWVSQGQAVNSLNNCSYRQMGILSATQTPTWMGSTGRTQPAIAAWKAADPDVTLVSADYLDQGITARFWVAAKVTANPDGTWTYEYALYNLNADRAASSFSIPIPPGAIVTSPKFHGLCPVEGELASDSTPTRTKWPATIGQGSVTWNTLPQADPRAVNALRWGYLYNFRCTINVPPATCHGATIGLFKPPTPASTAATVWAMVPVPGAGCGSADFNGDGDEGTDADIAAFFACISGQCCPTCGGPDFNGDCDPATDADIVAFFHALGGGSC
jgi:hypothetical protein